MEKINNIYKNFVDEEKFNLIENKNEQNKYNIYIWFLFFFGILEVIYGTFFGFSVGNWYSNTMIVLEVLTLILFEENARKLLILESKYRVFKKKFYLPLFILLLFMLCLAFSVLAFFTTKVIMLESGGFSLKVNSIYFFAIFLPLIIVFVLITYFCFVKFFLKAIRKNMKNN